MDDYVTHQPQQCPPPHEARIRLRLTMEQWKSEDQKKKKTTVTTSESTVIAAATTTTKTKRKSLCLQLRSKMDDPDDIIYLTIPLCILFIALSYTTTLPNIITASTHPQQILHSNNRIRWHRYYIY
jgi:hypothetical protein